MPTSKRKRRSTSKTGFFGVRKNNKGTLFSASVEINGKHKSLGSFKTAKQAAQAYDKEAIRLLKPLSKLNYPKKAPVGYAPIQHLLVFRNTHRYRGVCNLRRHVNGIICSLTLTQAAIEHVLTTFILLICSITN